MYKRFRTQRKRKVVVEGLLFTLYGNTYLYDGELPGSANIDSILKNTALETYAMAVSNVLQPFSFIEHDIPESIVTVTEPGEAESEVEDTESPKKRGRPKRAGKTK